MLAAEDHGLDIAALALLTVDVQPTYSNSAGRLGRDDIDIKERSRSLCLVHFKQTIPDFRIFRVPLRGGTISFEIEPIDRKRRVHGFSMQPFWADFYCSHLNAVRFIGKPFEKRLARGRNNGIFRESMRPSVSPFQTYVGRCGVLRDALKTAAVFASRLTSFVDHFGR